MKAERNRKKIEAQRIEKEQIEDGNDELAGLLSEGYTDSNEKTQVDSQGKNTISKDPLSSEMVNKNKQNLFNYSLRVDGHQHQQGVQSEKTEKKTLNSQLNPFQMTITPENEKGKISTFDSNIKISNNILSTPNKKTDSQQFGNIGLQIPSLPKQPFQQNENVNFALNANLNPINQSPIINQNFSEHQEIFLLRIR